MPDRRPPKELIDNLDLLMNLEVLSDESDWKLLEDLDQLPPVDLVESAASEAKPAKEPESGN